MNTFLSMDTVIEVAYLIATALFILALKWLSSPTTARRGVFAGEAGMVLAIAGTLLHHGIVDYKWIAIALVLGTVIGIIRAFAALNDAAGKVTSGLMTEVGEALVATAIGIMVALPAIAFFNFFQRVIKGRLGRAQAFGNEVLALLKATRPGVGT